MLQVGTKICSVLGEMADTEEYGQDTETGPHAIGEIASVLEDQENCYSVVFPKGVWVFLSGAELETGQYIVCHEGG